MLPVGADAELIPPNGDVTVEDAPKTELVLAGTAEELTAAPNTGAAPKPLAVGATVPVPPFEAPKAGGLPELALPNAGA